MTPPEKATGMNLTREERERILAGDYAALKRDEDPGELEGEQIPLRRRRAHRVPVYSIPKFSGQRREIVDTQEVPEYWSAWIVLGKPTRHRSGGWRIPFSFHTDGQHDRVLKAGGPPGAPREPGLRTREREKPRPKGEGVGNYTDETARGYGGGGDQALDFGGVDDATLEQFRHEAAERWGEHMAEERSDELDAQRARRLAEKIRRLQAEAAQLGVDIAPALERAIGEAQGQIVDERHSRRAA